MTALAAIAAVLLLTVGVLIAYFTDEEQAQNAISIGHNTITPVEEFVPPDELVEGVNTYKKDVAIMNEGDSVACYVRVAVEFSDDDIAKVSGYTADETVYYSCMTGGIESITTADGREDDGTLGVTGINKDAYINHLPSDWVYIAPDDANDSDLGGDYYYTKGLAPGETTESLFKKVTTYFKSKDDIKDYDIYVYAESVQDANSHGESFTGENTWKQAWKEFLANNTRTVGGGN